MASGLRQLPPRTVTQYCSCWHAPSETETVEYVARRVSPFNFDDSLRATFLLLPLEMTGAPVSECHPALCWILWHCRYMTLVSSHDELQSGRFSQDVTGGVTASPPCGKYLTKIIALIGSTYGSTDSPVGSVPILSTECGRRSGPLTSFENGCAMAHSRDVSFRAGTQLMQSSCRYWRPPRDANKCHSCCMWTRVLWQAVRQQSDGNQLDATDLGQLVRGVTFILFFKGGETRNRVCHYGGSPLRQL